MFTGNIHLKLKDRPLLHQVLKTVLPIHERDQSPWWISFNQFLWYFFVSVSFRPWGKVRFITQLILIFIDISSGYVAFSCKLASSTAFCKACMWCPACCLKMAAIWGMSFIQHSHLSFVMCFLTAVDFLYLIGPIRVLYMVLPPWYISPHHQWL